MTEPGYVVYDFGNYRYHSGTTVESDDLYPNGYLKMIYGGNRDSSESVAILVQGARAGAQEYGALTWPGDINSSFEAFYSQINSGLDTGMASIPRWAADIGGFHGGSPEDLESRGLMVRWFQCSAFSPILHTHGDYLSYSKPLSNFDGGSIPISVPSEI